MIEHAASSREAEPQRLIAELQQQVAGLQQQLVKRDSCIAELQLNLAQALRKASGGTQQKGKLHQIAANDDDQDNADVLSVVHDTDDDNTKLLEPAGATAKLDETMQQVKVTDMGGRDAVDMELPNTSSITDVKHEVQKATGTPTSGQTLFGAATGEEMSDEQTLRDVVMSEGSMGDVLEMTVLIRKVFVFSNHPHTTKTVRYNTAQLLEPNLLSGDSGAFAYLSENYCRVGQEMKYYVKVEGSNYVSLGAATPDLDLDVAMFKNKRVWYCNLYNRNIYLAGKPVRGGRRAGYDDFVVPCTLEVTVNSANGTLALCVVGGGDLGVVIDATLPKQQPLHLVVGSCDQRCKVTLLTPEAEAGT